MRILVIALTALIVLSSACYAGACDPCNNRAGLSCPGMKINVCPAGDFELIRNGCTGVGTQYIWIEARDDCDGDPIPGIPPTDSWLNSCNSSMQLWLCAEPLTADSATGANGRTTFTGVIRAGGCNIPAGSLSGGGIYVAIQGKPVLSQPSCLTYLCLPVDIKSPDLTGAGGHPDGKVNLSDIVVFGTSYNTTYPGPYPPNKTFNACCDYTDDGTCSLSDFAFFGTHYMHKCF